MSGPDREAVELFLQEASEHLQYLREYVGVLQEITPKREDMERLYIAAHTLSGTSGSYGYTKFSEVAGKLAHVFQYALNATLGEDLHGGEERRPGHEGHGERADPGQPPGADPGRQRSRPGAFQVSRV